MGVTKAWVVCGEDGMDELTTTGETLVAEVTEENVRIFTISPESLGLKRIALDEIKGQDSEYNAKALTALLGGKKNAYRDIVLLNAAAGLVVADRVHTLEEGLLKAAESLDSGKAQEVLAHLAQVMK